ncbi:MAG: McrC family protein [Actinomycetota bacterium]|nr:McrC family protein [Actinomycetota bacterium]
MTEPLIVKDLSPFDASDDEAVWLARLQDHVRASDHVIRLGEPADEADDFVVSRDPFGRWQAGRYIGELSFEGRRLIIEPRLGTSVIEQWLSQALNLIAVPHSSRQLQSESFIALLMAAVWSQRVALASRHGPPAFRRDHEEAGFYVRGRLDVRRTARLRGSGSHHVGSVRRFRDLDNDVSRTLVAAERTLTNHIGHDHWHTPRVEEVLPLLRAAVGARPRLPSERDLRRIRYTPITRPFRQAAELSWRIAKLRGFVASSEEGQAEGLLLDVAELWELFVLNCVRRAAPGRDVEHGTTTSSHERLLHSQADDTIRMGRLRPDVLVRRSGDVVAVVDAKYKRLVNTKERPDGVDRGDLYQLTSYLARFASDGKAPGALVYPRDPDQQEMSSAEAHDPWRSAVGNTVRFVRLALDPADAVTQLADDGWLVGQIEAA